MSYFSCELLTKGYVFVFMISSCKAVQLETRDIFEHFELKQLEYSLQTKCKLMFFRFVVQVLTQRKIKLKNNSDASDVFF